MLSVAEEGVTVLYVDYGNSEQVREQRRERGCFIYCLCLVPYFRAL